MDLNLRVVHYLLVNKRKIEVEQTLNSFFENGINFPQFIALAFDIESIPDIIPDPITSFHKNSNNNLALKYLFDNNLEIAKISPNYSTDKDKSNLLYLVLIKQVYKIDLNNIFCKCNQLVQPFGVEFKTKNDILDIKCLLYLLSILTDNKIQIDNEIKDIDQILIQIFEIAKAPLVIDKSCFQMPNQYLLLIQIEIIFYYFSEKVHHILNSKFSGENEKNQKKELGRTHKLINFQFDSLILSNTSSESFYSQSLDELTPKKNKEKQKRTKKIQYDETPEILIEKMNDEVLLKTLNEIGKCAGLHFNDMQQSVENDNLPKFVMYLLQDNSIIKNEDDENDKKIEIVLNYLIQKEPAFDHLLFDFNDVDYVESSAILFYTNLLNFFFLKQSREKLYDRVYTLLYGKYVKSDKKYIPYSNKREIMTDWNTYIKLISLFYLYKSTKKYSHKKKYVESLIKKKMIPFVLTREYLKEYESSDAEIPFGFYYQLQFIFDIPVVKTVPYVFITSIIKIKNVRVPSSEIIAVKCKALIVKKILITACNAFENVHVPKFNILNYKIIKRKSDSYKILCDLLAALNKLQKVCVPKKLLVNKIKGNGEIESQNIFYVIEIFLTAIRKLNNIRIPKTDQLIKSVRGKNISLILQKKRQNERAKKKKNENQMNRYDKEHYAKKYENKLQKYSKEIPKMPKTFNERVDKNKYKIHKQEMKRMQLTKGIKFWNPIDKSYNYNGSIIFKDDNDNDSLHRFTELLSYMKDDSHKKKTIKDITNYFSTKEKEQTELYKLLYYDTELLSWVFNEEVFVEFTTYAKVINSKAKYPIVFIMNSLEEEIITFTSNLFKKELPNIPDNNSIYFYGICDDALSDLIITQEKTKDKEIIKPIFLLLHIPDKSDSRSIPGIKKIIYQAYIFLSFISDINIVILTPGLAIEQINLINNIYEIKKTYKYEKKTKSETQTKQNLEASRLEKEQEILNIDHYDDFDEYDEYDDFVFDDNDSDPVYLRKKFLNYIDDEIIGKEMKLILLINEPEVKCGEPKKDFLNAPLFQNLCDTLLENLMPCYIDIENENTYGYFLDLFKKCAITGMATFSNIKYLFSSLPLFEMSSKYIDFKLKESAETLSKIIQGRFDQKMKSKENIENEFSVISNLQAELLHTYPILDESYHVECKKVLAELKKKYTHEHETIFKEEIQESSKISLDYLTKIIESEPLFTIHDIHILQNSHEQFLKEEFVRIIHYFYDSSLFATIYEDNMKVLNDQIQADTEIFNKKLKDFENSHSIREEIKLKPQQGTNYTVRERENEREITIRVDIGGELEKLIEQDF